MTDRTGGIGQADAAKPEVLADAIVNAAEARLSKMTDEQKPKNVEGIMKAATSHLSKREQRETGKVHKESVAAKAQSAMSKALLLEGGVEDVTEAVRKKAVHRGLIEQ